MGAAALCFFCRNAADNPRFIRPTRRGEHRTFSGGIWLIQACERFNAAHPAEGERLAFTRPARNRRLVLTAVRAGKISEPAPK